MSFARSILRTGKFTLISTATFAAGFASFAHAWPPNITPLNKSEIQIETQSLTESIKQSKKYKSLLANSEFDQFNALQLIPEAHKQNHIGQGLLNSPNHLAVEPIIFVTKPQEKPKYKLIPSSLKTSSLISSDASTTPSAVESNNDTQNLQPQSQSQQEQKQEQKPTQLFAFFKLGSNLASLQD
ncbi:unnamed protein product [Ambrosiozyma monospora]|uniref:Unnamed protein product n=1 Tax=Ambrosiozyma monospora TaxID=43982 RepID=A0A9W6WJM2_AMBMO|nr:unnamed protein product [Ambrosiozyma monospora]